MRFWSRSSPKSVGSKKQTRNEQRSRPEPIFRQRRPFSDPRAEESYQVPPPESPTGQWQSAVDPSDGSAGGRQEREQLDGIQRRNFAVSNLTVDRTYDANSTSTAELADVLGTFIQDVQRRFLRIEEQLRELRSA